MEETFDYIPPVEQDIEDVTVPAGQEFTEIMELLVHLAQEYPDECGMSLYEPVTEDDIRQFEEKNGITLTGELRAFYQFTNGLSMDSGNLELDPLAMIEQNLSNEYEWGDTKHYVLLGDMIGDGEIILYDLDTQHIFTNDHGEEEEFEDLTTLLDYILEVFVSGEVEDEQLEAFLEGAPEEGDEEDE